MPSSRFDEVRDYAFADQALALRKRAGLTQRDLATLLQVNVQSIHGWENGLFYPGTEHLQRLIALYLDRGVLTAGREEAEAEALWDLARARATRRIAPFDRAWFASLHGGGEETGRVMPIPPRASNLVQHDWGDAPMAPVIHGRGEELATLARWIRAERCRVVQVLGRGGIGKTVLATRLAQDLAPEFPVVYWRSLRNAPPPEEWLAGAITILSAAQVIPRDGLEARLALVLGLLRDQRGLLVLDHLESVLEPGTAAVRYRAGYEGYGEALRRLGASAHQGCVLLTSREQPLRDDETAVRSLRLGGLGVEDCRALLENRRLIGDEAAWQALVERYAGNPLALRMVAETIGMIFNGEIVAFLAQETAVFGDFRQVLDEQVTRLSALERAVATWLTVEREPVGFAELLADLGSGVVRSQVVVAVEALQRRSLLKLGAGGTYTLQPVLLEYGTARLVDQICKEVLEGEPALLVSHALVKAQAKEYVRRSQERLIAQPLLEQLRTSLGSAEAAERKLLALLETWRGRPWEAQGYGPGNVVNLLRLLRGDLRGQDLSHLSIRHAYLQGVAAQDASLAGAHLSGAVLTEAINDPAAAALSAEDEILAAGTAAGQVFQADPALLPGSVNRVRTLRADRRYERLDVTGLTGVSEAQRAALLALGALDREAAPGTAAAPAQLSSPSATTAAQIAAPSPGPGPVPPVPDRPPTNVRAARTTFVGRSTDLAALAQALDPNVRARTRLLTLTGVAGSGKTRLALAVAEAVRDVYRDGVWLVELAPLPASAGADFTAVVAATLAALDLHEQPGQEVLDTLIANLRTRHLLLVLDNCEHLVVACSALATQLLAACPQLQILTTSQQPLGSRDEIVWPVTTLAVPPLLEATPTPEVLHQVEQVDAVQLFVARAQAVRPGFALSAASAVIVATICRRLDGLPLAIELAAARLGVLPLQEILARLDDRFRLLRRGGRTADDRHQALQATMDWSYGLLDPAEQAVLRRLAVFAGGWELAAAEAVCAGPPGGTSPITPGHQEDEVEADAVLELLDELQDRSLVYVYVADKTPRYGMLETVRQYGLQQLEHAAERAVVQDRHLHWCIALAEQAAPSLQGAEQDVWLARLEREHDNLRAALRWSLGMDAAGAEVLRLAGALARFWLMHAHFSEGRYWLGEALAAEGGTGAERAQALDGAGLLAEGQGAYEEATRLLEESLALWRTIGDRAGVARALTNLGMVVERQSNYAWARALLEEALTIFRGLDARGDIAGTLAALGFVVEFQGDYETGRSLLEQGLSQFRALGDEWGIANTLGNMAITARRHGQYDRALALYEEALTLARALGDRRGVTRWLNGLALSLASQGEYDRAQAYLEESLALSRTLRDRRGMAFSLNDLGEVARKQGAYDRARDHFEQSLSLLLQFGDNWLIANAYRNLAGVATEAGDEERAAELLPQSLALFQALGDRWGIAQCLELGSRVAAGRERWAAAAQLLAGAEALRGSIDTQLDPYELEAHEYVLRTVRTALGEKRVADLWTTGSALALDEIAALLASALHPEGTTRTADRRDHAIQPLRRGP